jgi:hypothetical protein
MKKPCYTKNISNPLICGVHNVAIVQRQILIDSNAPGLGRVTCYMCPVSRAVVREMVGFKTRSSVLPTARIH